MYVARATGEGKPTETWDNVTRLRSDQLETIGLSRVG